MYVTDTSNQHITYVGHIISQDNGNNQNTTIHELFILITFVINMIDWCVFSVCSMVKLGLKTIHDKQRLGQSVKYLSRGRE